MAIMSISYSVLVILQSLVFPSFCAAIELMECYLASSDELGSGRQKILFYHSHDPHYGFTNFSDHPVVYNGKRYPTSEHLFQSFKVTV